MTNLIIRLFVLLAVFLVSQPIFTAPVKILPLGDSITDGDGPVEDPLPTYRRGLWHNLINSGYQVDFVGSKHNYTNTPISINLRDFDPDYEGHSGLEAGELDQNIAGWLLEYDADIALIHAGTNDIDRGQSIQSTLDELAGIISKLRFDNPNIIILIAEIIPMRNTDTAAFNTELVAWAPSQNTANSPVIVVDQYSGYDPFADNFDNYHPNASGQLKMVTRWFDALIQLSLISESYTPPINGMTLWLDATDVDANGVTDALVDGDAVSLWKDKSNQANDVASNAISGIPTLQLNSLNSLPVIDFDGSSRLVAPDADQISADSSYTKFVVFKFDDTAAANNLISSDETALWGANSDSIKVWHGSFNPHIIDSDPTTVGTTNYQVVSARYGQPDSLNNILNLNGLNLASNTNQENHDASTTSIGSLGDSNYLDGKIAEAIIYDRALSDTEISCVEAYLANKWGLATLSTCGIVNQNQSPIINAGADRTVLNAGDSISLQGSASDDGLPSGSSLSTQWSQLSGPGTVTFSDALQLTSDASFTAEGSYVLQLLGSDSELTSTDTLTVQVGDVDIQTGLMGHWTLDEVSGTVAADASGNANHGTLRNISGNPWVGGQLGGALVLDGVDDDVAVATSSELQPSSLTLSAWFKADASASDWGWIVGEGDNYGLFVDQRSGKKKLFLYFYNGSTWVSKGVDNTSLFDEQWHHVAATFDASTGVIKLYIDTVEAGSKTVGGAITYAAGSGVHIGSMLGSRNLQGSLDDVRIYGQALSQSAIAAVSNL